MQSIDRVSLDGFQVRPSPDGSYWPLSLPFKAPVNLARQISEFRGCCERISSIGTVKESSCDGYRMEFCSNLKKERYNTPKGKTSTRREDCCVLERRNAHGDTQVQRGTPCVDPDRKNHLLIHTNSCGSFRLSYRTSSIKHQLFRLHTVGLGTCIECSWITWQQ